MIEQEGEGVEKKEREFRETEWVYRITIQQPEKSCKRRDRDWKAEAYWVLSYEVN